jgi:hypothetical protein
MSALMKWLMAMVDGGSQRRRHQPLAIAVSH